MHEWARGYQGATVDEGPRWLNQEERERKEALNHLARQRGEEVIEAPTHSRKGGRWGKKVPSQRTTSRERNTSSNHSRKNQNSSGSNKSSHPRSKSRH